MTIALEVRSELICRVELMLIYTTLLPQEPYKSIIYTNASKLYWGASSSQLGHRADGLIKVSSHQFSKLNTTCISFKIL